MPGQVNYWLVQDGQVGVRDHSSLITASQFNDGLAYWNDGIGATIAVSSCTDFGVELVDVADGDCGYHDPPQNTIPAGACADYPELDPITGSARVRGMYVAPYLPNESTALDDVFFPFVIAHEFGHNLGFNHIYPSTSPSCAYSIMHDPRCEPDVLTALAPADIDNFQNAYHVDPVTSLSGTSPGPGQVTLSWNAADIHNENSFLIERQGECGGWGAVAWIAKDLSSWPLINQNGGTQTYRILGLGAPSANADGHGDPAYVAVTGYPPFSPPNGPASTFPSTSVNRFTWSAVPQAQYYIVRMDVVPSGNFSPTCYGNQLPHDITTTQFDWPVPGAQYPLAPFYTSVLACTASDVCSPSTSFAVSERFASGAWNYAFTYSRSGDDINFQFINFNPYSMALQLHIRNGDQPGSPLVADTPCVPAGAPPTSIPPMSAYYSFSSGKLATQGHGALSADTCRPPTDHGGDSPIVGWGYIPPYTEGVTPTPTPAPVGGVTSLTGRGNSPERTTSHTSALPSGLLALLGAGGAGLIFCARKRWLR